MNTIQKRARAVREQRVLRNSKGHFVSDATQKTGVVVKRQK